MAASRASSAVAAVSEGLDVSDGELSGVELSMKGVFVTPGAGVALELGAGEFDEEPDAAV